MKPLFWLKPAINFSLIFIFRKIRPYALASLALLFSTLAGISDPGLVFGKQSKPSSKAQTSLPDLIINLNLWMQGQTGSCVTSYAPYGLQAYVQNTGTADAGSFVVEVNGAQQIVAGLPAGTAQILWFSNLASNGVNTGTVDINNAIAESDEANNSTIYVAVTPTPPAICTSTPTPTSTFTPTPTRTPTPTPTSIPGANFVGSPLSGNAPLTTQFTHLDSSMLSICTWYFGDGATQTYVMQQNIPFSPCPSATHVYTTSGLYSVTLNVTKFTNGYTNSFTRDNYVEVLSPPTQTPTLTPTPTETPVSTQEPIWSHRLFLPNTMRDIGLSW